MFPGVLCVLLWSSRGFLCYQKKILVCPHLCFFPVFVLGTLAHLPQVKMRTTQRNVEQVQAPDQWNQDKSSHNQNMCNKEGQQTDKCRSKYNASIVYKQNR